PHPARSAAAQPGGQGDEARARRRGRERLRRGLVTPAAVPSATTGGTMAITDEQPDLSAWIERTTSGSIVRAERQGRWRVQWVVDVKTPAGTLPLVARMPRDPEFVRLSAFTSHYDTRREARILEALH